MADFESKGLWNDDRVSREGREGQTQADSGRGEEKGNEKGDMQN